MPTILTAPQRRYFRWVLGLAIFVLANSAYLFFADRGAHLTAFYQAMLISHLAGGALLLVMATVFLVWHLGRVRKLMRPVAALSGVGIAAAAYLLFATGLFVLYESNSREHMWVFWSHRALAVLAPCAYAVHRFVSHFAPERRAAVRGLLNALGLLVAMLVVHAATLPTTPPAPAPPAPPDDPYVPFEPKNYPAPSSRFFPSSATTTSGGFFEARILTRDERGDFERIRDEVERLGFASTTTIGAETCRRCHPDAVAQWETSAHRFSSFNNPFYRTSVEKFRETAGKERSQWCAGCHDPAIMLAGNMTKEIDPLVPESQAGLTCLACHAIDRLHGLEGNGNYNIADETPSPYLFDSAADGPGRFLADQLIKAKPGPHKRMMLKPFFRTSEFCSACHKVSLDVPVNSYRFFRGQNEYDNWHDSGVSQNAARTFYLPKAVKVCQDCHMPPEDAPLGDVAAKNGKIRSHRFLAVNTALPYVRGDFDTIDRIERFLRDEKLTVDLFAMQVGPQETDLIRAIDRSLPNLVPGEEVVFEVVVRNKGVGHTFPGGTNDSNESWIDFRVTDAESGEELMRSGAIDDARFVDRHAHFYRVVMVRHDGTEANERDPQNFHIPAFARVIGPGTADVARYVVRVPEGALGRRLRVEAKLQWRKFNRSYTEFVFARRGVKVPELPHLAGVKVPDLPVTTIAEDAILLTVASERGGSGGGALPEDWMRFNDHGIASFLQDAFEVAEASWAEVARLRPDLPDGWRNQARRWIQSGQPEKAAPFLRKVDDLSPRDPQRPYFWGRYFERLDEFEKAEEAFVACLEVFPDDRDALRRLGGVRYKLHKYEESLDAYLQVLAIDPEDLESHKRRLDIYRQIGRAERAGEAERAFDKYRRDDEAQEIAREFLLRHPEINEDSQKRHTHR